MPFTQHNHPLKLGFGVSSLHDLFQRYREGARRRGYFFDLLLEEFQFLTSSDCHYCGAKPNHKHKLKNAHGFYIYNGVDRVDNTSGYNVENCVPCCRKCNTTKGKIPISMVRKIAQHQGWVK